MSCTDVSNVWIILHHNLLCCLGCIGLHQVALQLQCIATAVHCIHHTQFPHPPPHRRLSVSCCRRLLVSLRTSLLGCCRRGTWLLLLTAEVAHVMLRSPQVTLELALQYSLAGSPLYACHMPVVHEQMQLCSMCLMLPHTLTERRDGILPTAHTGLSGCCSIVKSICCQL